MRELEDLQIGKTVLKFEAIEGVVVNEKKWSETHVRSYGGGAYSGPSVHSRNTTRHEVWIKQHGSNEETQLDLSDCGVETREGHEVAAVAVNVGEQRRFVLFANRSAQLIFPLACDYQKVVASIFERPRGFFKAAILSVVIAWMVGIFGQAAWLDFFGDGDTPVGPGIGVGVFLVGITRNVSRRSKYRRNLSEAGTALASHIRLLGSQLLEDGNQKGQ
jgi:hypothetical protein